MNEKFVTENQYTEVLQKLEKLNQSLINYKETLAKYDFKYSFDINTLLNEYGESNFKLILKNDIKVSISMEKSADKDKFKRDYINDKEFNKHQIIEDSYLMFINNFHSLINENPEIGKYEIKYNIISIENTLFTKFLDNVKNTFNDMDIYFTLFTGMKNMQHDDIITGWNRSWEWYYDMRTGTFTEAGINLINTKIGNDSRFYNIIDEKIISFEL
ncbi:MAG: hypothetical protein NTW16_00210 [Bacteroidetes bacterium]|nr:hypothetical protein [Bacteroidota bacterium]